jgi:hypothetical protein
MPQPAPVRNSRRAGVASQVKSIGRKRGAPGPTSHLFGSRHRREAILDTAAAGPVNGRLLRMPAVFPRRPAGAVAQLGERRNRTAEVRGSNPLSSTKARS